MRKAPPLPFLPEEWHGREVLVFAACYAGDIAEGEKAMAELRGLGKPIADVIGPMPFAGWQQALRPAADARRAQLLEEPRLPRVLRRRDRRGRSRRSARCPIRSARSSSAHLGGAMARVPADATAFPQRTAHFTMNVHTRWDDPAKDAACIAWARDLFDRRRPSPRAAST